MGNKSIYKNASVKVYYGYGHTHNLIVYGHVFKRKAVTQHKFTNNILYNIFHLFRLFFVQPFPHVKVRLHFQDQKLENITEDDGFFKFEWEATQDVSAGWHYLAVDLVDETRKMITTGAGKIYIPHITQYGFISDIDDTIMVSHSATVGRRLKELFIHNPRTRTIFSDVAAHYALLSLAHTTEATPNPFFYVSSSEWNLYDYLDEFFSFNGLPQGAFLLNQIKRWFELVKTGKTKHQGKFLRIVRILEAFPKQQFILFGDNTQNDPVIYASVAQKLPSKIFAVYIRSVIEENNAATKEILSSIEQNGVHACLFKTSKEAIEHSKLIGLIRSETETV